MFCKSIFRNGLLVMVCLLAAACQTTGSTPGKTSAANHSKVDAALERAASSAAQRGNTNQSLGYMEKIYKRNSADPEAAMRYASALRGADYLNQADLVLAPFAKDAKSPAGVKAEYAAIQLALGNNKSAETFARKAVAQDPALYESYHYLGIAQDAQGQYEEGEKSFRTALENWQGDPVPVMNNLALNLSAQNKLDEAIDILMKAKEVAPNRIEVERNLRIMTTLQQSMGRDAPKPKRKPALVMNH